MRHTGCLRGYLFLGIVFATGVCAKETVSLTVIDAYAPTASWVRVFIEAFIPAVDDKLSQNGHYEVKWNQAFSGSVAKTSGVFDALKHDLADIGLVTTPFHGDKLPFYNLSYVTPFVTSNNVLVIETINQLVDKYPELNRGWYENNQIPLTAAGSIDTYTLLLTGKPGALADLEGRRIGGIGLNLRYLEGLNATQVVSPLTEWYLGMDTGLLQGVIAWASAAVSYKLYEVAPYMLDAKMSTTTSTVVSMNRKTYQGLPEEVRQAITEAAVIYRNVLAEDTTRLSEISRGEYIEFGGEIIDITPAQRKNWAMALPNLATEWVDNMEQNGYPGHAILRDYMDIMRANEHDIIRHWDRE